MHTSNQSPLVAARRPVRTVAGRPVADARAPAHARPSADARLPADGTLPAETTFPADTWLARRVARAASSFEHGLLGRSPTSVTVVGSGGWMVVHLQEPFSQLERRLAREDQSAACRVAEFHRQLFDQSVEALCEHVHQATGVAFRGGLAHIDVVTGSIHKTLATATQVDVFLMGQGLPALGVPVNTHLQARPAWPGHATSHDPHASGTPGLQPADGTGAAPR